MTRAIGPIPNPGRPTAPPERGRFGSRSGIHPSGSTSRPVGRDRSPPAYTEPSFEADTHGRTPTSGAAAQAGDRGDPGDLNRTGLNVPCDNAARMATPRGKRPAHVRPRPPSTGRPAPVKVRPRPPTSGRTSQRRRVEPSRRLPLPVRLVLVAGLTTLGVVVVAGAVGGLSRAVGAIGDTFSSFVEDVTATVAPSATIATISDAPSVEAPDEPYTSAGAIDLVVTLPPDTVGRAGAMVRIFLTLPDQAAAPIAERPVGAGPRVVFPVELTPGENGFSATVVTAGGESEPSPIVTFIRDNEPPTIVVSSPKNDAIVNRDVVTLVGKTQARSTLVARNEANGASIAAEAGSDGSFELVLALAAGSNAISIAATDPAGNLGESVLTVRRGSGALKAQLTANRYTFSAAKLPLDIVLRVVVTDPDGRPLGGATATFSLTMPGLPAITAYATTGADGLASFSTSLPKGTARGQGLATVLVTTAEFGSATDRSVITIAK